MSKRDPLRELLREWQAPEPGAEFDGRVVDAFRTAFRTPVKRVESQPAAWRRLLRARISIPVPALLAGVAIVALILWFRPASTPSAPPDTPGIVTRLNVSGFEPLPDGAARVVPVKETH